KSTAGALDTYTAKSNAFTGSETIAVSATLSDAAGNSSGATTLTLNQIDTTAPTVTSLTDVTSNGNDLAANQTVAFTLTASEALTIANGAALTLSNGATAVYNNSSGKFVYTVAAGQATADLKVTGYSGSISDAAGNALAQGGVTLDSGVRIDTTAPTVTIGTAGGNTNQPVQTISGTVGAGDVGATTVNVYDNGG